MKEFDFDELDKAVNSLMGDIQKPTETPTLVDSNVALEAPKEPASPLPVSPTLPPSAPAVENTPVESTPPTSSLPVSVPPRSSGRFMDVVHPSAAVKPATLAPSREGKTLQPTSRLADVSTPSRPVIDVMASTLSPSKPTSEPVSAPSAPVSVPQPEPDLPPDPTPTEPWVSPFLPDAQVEKRPLGGVPPVPPVVDLSDAMATELSQATEIETTSTPAPAVDPAPAPQPTLVTEEPITPPEESLPETPSPVRVDDQQLAPKPEPAPLPAELNSDLVAIESGQAQPSLDTERVESTEAATSNSSGGSLASRAMSTASIPQQYREQPSTGDESHTPIYDNESVHHPLAHPAKKKSGWMLVIFIIIILVIGGALGAAAYFLGLI